MSHVVEGREQGLAGKGEFEEVRVRVSAGGPEATGWDVEG